jgi:hypothetical protein
MAAGMMTPTNAPLQRYKGGAFPSTEWLEANGTKLKDTAN